MRPAVQPRRRGRPKKPGAGVCHVARPVLHGWTPVHVTLRVVAGVPSLRGCSVFRAVHRALSAGNRREGFRLVHYAVQRTHIHLLVEAQHARSLSSGMQALSIRLARRLNSRFSRSGRLFRDRYFSRPLRDTRAARDALRYVLNNARRHCPWARRVRTRWVDPCSSAPFFDGWSVPPGVPQSPLLPRDALLISLGNAGLSPRTPLLGGAWRRAGPIEITYVPGPPE